MESKKEETASFMIRFTQKVFQEDNGEQEVQWRGNIRHVQDGDEKRFSEFEDALAFMQKKLTHLTIQAMQDKTPEEQRGILSKSFGLWKKMALGAPKMVMETIKDPKKQVAQLQDQIQEQIQQVRGDLSQRLELDSWLKSSKGEQELILQKLEELSQQMTGLQKKVDQLAKKKTK